MSDVLEYCLCAGACESCISFWRGAQRLTTQSSITLLHQPTGYDDPYVILPNERFPREPEAGDTVFVRLLTQPFQASQDCDRAYYCGRGSGSL